MFDLYLYEIPSIHTYPQNVTISDEYINNLPQNFKLNFPEKAFNIDYGIIDFEKAKFEILISTRI